MANTAGRWIAVTAAVAICGCTATSPPLPPAALQTGRGPAFLELPSPDGRRHLTVGDRSVLIEGFSDASLAGTWGIGGYTVVAVRGASSACPVRVAFVAVDDLNTATSYLGGCPRDVGLRREGRGIAATETGVTDPRTWVFADGVLHPPVRRSAAAAHRQPSAGARDIIIIRNTDEPFRSGALTVPDISPLAGDDVIPLPVDPAPQGQPVVIRPF